jgi:hypothetical protein
MMNDLDVLLRSAAPEPVVADSPPGRAARELASEVKPRSGRRKRWAWSAGIAGILVLGGGAAAVATPGLFDWSWGSADTLSVEEFPVGGVGAGQRCVMAIWAEADPGASSELKAAVEKAQTFLHEHDWDSLDSDTGNIWAQQRKTLVANGTATPVQLASLTAAQVRDDLEQAGLIVPGMSIPTRIDCRDGAGE